jgi:Zn-dependent M28 family amino/carboxypeptidase
MAALDLFSDCLHFVPVSANNATAAWIADDLSSWGYEITSQGVYNNIVAFRSEITGPVILVGAHYDSVPGTPGADDNGSAVAALLGCAKACALFFPDLPVVFVAFNGEEDGLLGSSEVVTDYLPFAPFQTVGCHILEMVGYASSEPKSQVVPPGLPISLPDRGDFIGLLTNRDGAKLLKLVLQDIRTEVPGLPANGVEVLLGLEKFFPVLHRSDHAPFWKERIPTLLWTDTSEFRNPHYHAPTDTPSTLDYDFLQQVTQAITATLILQARGV